MKQSTDRRESVLCVAKILFAGTMVRCNKTPGEHSPNEHGFKS